MYKIPVRELEITYWRSDSLLEKEIAIIEKLKLYRLVNKVSVYSFDKPTFVELDVN